MVMQVDANIPYNFQALLDTVALAQGSILAILLIVLNKRKYRSTFFLGLFLLVLSLKLVMYIPISLNLIDVNPSLLLLPFNFFWLLFPLFFIYTQQVSVLSEQKTKYWVLIPGILSFLFQVIIYFLPYEIKLNIAQSQWYDFTFKYMGIAYSWIIAIWNLRLLYRHRIVVQNSFSMVASKALRWARIFLIYSLATSLISHVLFYLYPQNYSFKIVYSVFDLVAIYWVSYHGVVQRNVLSLLSRRKSYGIAPEENSDLQPSLPIDKIALEELMEKIDRYMVMSECYVQPELTIMDLAEYLKVHPKRISTAINTISQQNFNSYVNGHRIKKAKDLLQKNEGSNFSIEGIGIEAGFYSKSAFYSAFKKETGTTPTKFNAHIEDVLQD
tara:strand:+ start:52 stop:1203 length:1152 start_codon:yes stop_codon:yes gene_type:complete